MVIGREAFKRFDIVGCVAIAIVENDRVAIERGLLATAMIQFQIFQGILSGIISIDLVDQEGVFPHRPLWVLDVVLRTHHM